MSTFGPLGSYPQATLPDVIFWRLFTPVGGAFEFHESPIVISPVNRSFTPAAGVFQFTAASASASITYAVRQSMVVATIWETLASAPARQSMIAATVWETIPVASVDDGSTCIIWGQ